MKYYGGFLVSGLLSLKGSLLAIKIFTIILCKLLYVFVCQINVFEIEINTYISSITTTNIHNKISILRFIIKYNF